MGPEESIRSRIRKDSWRYIRRQGSNKVWGSRESMRGLTQVSNEAGSEQNLGLDSNGGSGRSLEIY